MPRTTRSPQRRPAAGRPAVRRSAARSVLWRISVGPVRGQSGAFAGASVLAVAKIAVDLARPWPLAVAIDEAFDGRGNIAVLAGLPAPAVLGVAAVATVALGAASGILQTRSTTAAEQAAERISTGLRADVFDHGMQLSLRWHDRTRSGEFVSRLTSDVGRVLDAVIAVAARLVPQLVALVAVLVVLALLDPGLALIGLAVTPGLVVVAYRQRREVRAAQVAARTAAGQLTAATTDLVRNVAAVQAFGRRDRAVAEFGLRNEAVLDAESAALRTEARWAPRADLVLAAGSGLVLFVGGLQVLDGTQTTGHLLVVLTYLAELYAPIRSLTRMSSVLAKAAASAQRIADVLDSTELVADRPGALPVPPEIQYVQFRDVSFRYAADRPVLDCFDLGLRAGETVCLLGPSGAGKSTLLSLLLRLYDVDGGAVLIDGVDIRDLQLQSLRERIAYVPQDPWLLDATLAQNIAFGNRGATRAAVITAGRLAHVDEFATRLPLGYDTPLGEGAGRLSGGQRRRVALARAIVSPAPLLLLDEPTSSLDSESAAAVIDAIRAAARGRTALVVTHDPRLAAIATRVVQVDAHTLRGVPTAAAPTTSIAGGR